MHRIAFVPILVIVIALAGCSDGGSTSTGTPEPTNGGSFDPVTPVARPDSVPEGARTIEEMTVLGQIERRANAAPETIDTRTLLTAACESEVMVLWTDQEIIHAALPCDRFWDIGTVQAFSGQEVAVVLDVTDQRFQIFVETVPGAQSEFTVSGIWVE
ncbi:MAG: hypothetical protein WD939_04930 [Dehalococcoidia bacterium]